LLVLVLLAGCSEKGGGTRTPNLPPDTFISSGPRQTSCNFYKVQTYWFGVDMDGRVDEYEVATIKGITRERAGTVDYDSLAWVRTTAKDSVFVLVTDSCCASEAGEWFDLSYWGILVRAVDNERARDPEPAAIFFQTCNEIPKVRITEPHIGLSEVPDLPPHFRLEWDGRDPDGDDVNMTYKYIVVPGLDTLPPLERDSSLVSHGAPPVGYWSGWVPADCTYVDDLNLLDYASPPALMLLAVTARDEAGGVLPRQLYGPIYNDGRNSFTFRVVPSP
jgi:hypothetical protein